MAKRGAPVGGCRKRRRSTMQTFKIKVRNPEDVDVMQREARKILPGSDLSLVAWYDRNHRTGGPLEVCRNESEQCARSYATHHGAQFEVDVNGRAVELFYAPTPSGTAELDLAELIEAHRGLDREDSVDDVQGG
jgi:hypothetical protein